MFVILDTNIYAADFRLTSPSFETLITGCARVGHTLVLPQLVLDELLNKCGEEYQKFLDAQRKLGFGPEGPIRTKRPEPTEKAKRLYHDYLLTRLPTAHRLRYPEISHETLVNRALRRAKPFRNTDTGGYRDVPLWYTIVEATQLSPAPIAFVTANVRDFSDPNDPSQLHPDLAHDLLDNSRTDANVTLFSNLDRFLQLHIIPTLSALADIRARLIADTFEPLNLRTFTSDDLQPLLGWKEFGPEEIGFPSEYETSHLSTIEDVEDIADVDVRQLSSDEILISYTVIAQCAFDVLIFRGDYYSLPDDELPYVWSPDWNEHYVAASDSSTVKLRIALVFSTQSGIVDSAQISSAAPTEEWWARKLRERP